MSRRTRERFERERRAPKVAEALAKGVPMTEAAKELGVCYNTVRRDKERIIDGLRKEAGASLDELRAGQLLKLAEMEALCEDSRIKPDRKVELLHSLLQTEIKLQGTAAPSRSITASIEVEHSPLFLKFKKHTAGLSEPQIDQVLGFASSLPREADSEVVDASWFPAKELPSGE